MVRMCVCWHIYSFFVVFKWHFAWSLLSASLIFGDFLIQRNACDVCFGVILCVLLNIKKKWREKVWRLLIKFFIKLNWYISRTQPNFQKIMSSTQLPYLNNNIQNQTKDLLSYLGDETRYPINYLFHEQRYENSF